MARPKSNKTVKSINFDKIVLEKLEMHCKKAKFSVSEFVNHHIKKCIMTDSEFAKEMAKHHCAEMHRWQKEVELEK